MSFIKSSIKNIRERLGSEKVICALSGGVDSTVLSVLLHRAVGDNSIPVLIDNGLMRDGEIEYIEKIFRDKFQIHINVYDYASQFLSNLKGKVDPEEKRKVIGELFIRVFEQIAQQMGDVKYLAQGTLYPDVIESRSTMGPSAVIKSHHNVGGLPSEVGLELLEPLKELFKDEVREIGKELDIPEEVLNRHPFPGPGLAVRVIGEVTESKLQILREADGIFIQELKLSGWYSRVWQALTVLVPCRTVGVMGDGRTYENLIALRAVTSRDGMTADWAKLPPGLLGKIANRIVNEVRGVNRVVYDVSSKPPSTIEWE